MGCTRSVALVLAFIVGCAAAPYVRVQWERYCCAGGTPDDPQGCRASEPPEIDACRESGGWALECRPTRVGECVGGGADCFCCREVGHDACTVRMRNARLEHGPSSPEPEPEEPEVTHRRPGRVWSPF